MKAEFPDHPKFLRLARLLDEPDPHVLGYCLFMWRRCYQIGSDCLGDELDVEVAAIYRGPRGKFAAAALEANLLERDDKGRYHVHDLFDHAPGYVKKRMARKGTAPEGAENYAGNSNTKRVQYQPTEVFQALAEVCAQDISIKRNFTATRRVATSLESADPPYTAADVRYFGEHYHELCPYESALNRTRPTLNEVEVNIGQLRAKPAPAQPESRRKPKTAGENREEYARRQAQSL